MKHKSKIYFLLVSVVLAASTLTACVQPPKASCEPRQIKKAAPVSKEIVVVMSPNLGFLDFENVITNATPKIQEIFNEKKNATFTVVLADGSPEIKSSSLIDVEKFGTFQADVDEEVQNAMRELTKVYRCSLGLDGVSFDTTDESDVTKALQKASDAFRSEGTQKEIFMLSNGISTAGQVNFVTNGMPGTENYSSMVDQYEEQQALVDLKGANVNWIGLGQTNGLYQEKLGTQSKDALVDFWKLFVDRSAGASSSIIGGNVVDGEPNPSSLMISKVVPSDVMACINEELDEDQGLTFNPADITFRNNQVAEASIERIASKIIKSGCSGVITVTGFVASATDKKSFDKNPDAGYTLSFNRAQVVANLLDQFGVKAQIEVKGGGWGGTPDWKLDGTFSEELGKLNRIVLIQQ